MINSFPGYEYVNGKNMYRGVDLGRGGYVWAKPGMYYDVWTFDCQSQHPSSIVALNLFGKYTDRFKEILDARIHIKHGELDAVREMFGGALNEYLDDVKEAKKLSNSLKTVINSAYGLTAASFDNLMRDNRNKNNIVALRGALFMKTLLDEVIARGGEPIHVKTDSIKVVHPSEELKAFIFDFAVQYGYTFEIEHVFDRLCLINNAVFIARLASTDPDHPGQWDATGAQFAHPYVFKTLFSHEKIIFEDYVEFKQVQTAMYLDFNEQLPEGEHDYKFVGKNGAFVPIKEGCGGAILVRRQDDKYNSVGGTKGYRWLESETVRLSGRIDIIDKRYYMALVDAAIAEIMKFGDPEIFINDAEVTPFCTKKDCETCTDRGACDALSAAY